MNRLSPQEKAVLDMLIDTVPSVVAIKLNITEERISEIKTDVRRKEANARKFLLTIAKYKQVLHRPKKYKGI